MFSFSMPLCTRLFQCSFMLLTVPAKWMPDTMLLFSGILATGAQASALNKPKQNIIKGQNSSANLVWHLTAPAASVLQASILNVSFERECVIRSLLGLGLWPKSLLLDSAVIVTFLRSLGHRLFLTISVRAYSSQHNGTVASHSIQTWRQDPCLYMSSWQITYGSYI